MRKRLLTAAMTAMMVVGSVFPSMAVTYQYETGSTEIINDYGYSGNPVRWASGQVMKFPGWAWINGYCYYFTDYGYENKLTSCTTPDGYEVDAEGRWCVNGVPQSNGYGSYVVGTDELYAGKSDDERWQIMHEKLEKLYAEHIPGDEFHIAMKSTSDTVNAGQSKEGYSYISVTHSGEHSPEYISVFFENKWNDCLPRSTPELNEMIEQTIKMVCGDRVGQELFNDIKAAADPCEGAPLVVPELDENGNWIWINEYEVKMKTIPANSDGVNFNYFDMNKWNNGKTTDYGKEIKIEHYYRHTSDETGVWKINIMK